MALPGVRTTILDRFYNQARTDLPGGPLIAVIAKRNNTAPATSPDVTPYLALGEQDVIAQFGENSQAHKAFYELSVGGSSRCVIVPLPANTTFNHNNATIASAGYTGNLFDDAFSAVEAVRADIVVPWGAGSDTLVWDDVATPATPGGNATDFFYADNSAVAANSWAAKIAQKCYDITFNSYPLLGVIGIKPIAGAENPSPNDLATGLNFPNLLNKDAIPVSPAVYVGQHLTVVAAEVHPIAAPTAWGWSNGATTYAALISRLPAWTSTTHKPVYNIDQMRYNLTRVQATAISTKGLVCAQLDFTRTPRWTDGMTFANTTSDYIRLSTVRIVFDAVKLIRTVSENYIGEGMSITMQNAFQTQISSSLQSMTKLGAINQSDFKVQYSPAENRAYVDLAIVPAFELREVYIQVSVNF